MIVRVKGAPYFHSDLVRFIESRCGKSYCMKDDIPANTTHLPNAGSVLAQRLTTLIHHWVSVYFLLRRTSGG